MKAAQSKLFEPRNRVPETTPLSGKVIKGYRIVTASDLKCAEACITFARVTGSVGGEDYHYEIAGPFVPEEQKKIVRWAIVERI